MAKIIENMDGRRQVRLSAEDILTVVTLYQQQFQGKPPKNYQEVKKRLGSRQYYLPEEI